MSVIRMAFHILFQRGSSMKTDPARSNKSANESEAISEEILGRFFAQAKAQFGDAVKAFWFFDGDFCPGCMARPLRRIKFRGRDALAINAFIYRPRGVLIGYFLCETCANFIFREAQKNPYKETPLHASIEQNLIEAYHKHLMSLDA